MTLRTNIRSLTLVLAAALSSVAMAQNADVNTRAAEGAGQRGAQAPGRADATVNAGAYNSATSVNADGSVNVHNARIYGNAHMYESTHARTGAVSGTIPAGTVVDVSGASASGTTMPATADGRMGLRQFPLEITASSNVIVDATDRSFKLGVQ